MSDNKLKIDIDLNKKLTKMATAIGSIYLVRHLIPLRARIVLLKSLVLSFFIFSAIFLQFLTVLSFPRKCSQIDWGIKVFHRRKKFDSARDF